MTSLYEYYIKLQNIRSSEYCIRIHYNIHTIIKYITELQKKK